MKVMPFRTGAHHCTITTDHRGAWISLKVTDGHTTVEVRLTPAQAGTLCDQLRLEQSIAGDFAARDRARTVSPTGG